MARLIIRVVDGQLSLASTPQSAAEINLLLDLAKQMLLEQGGPDEVLEEEAEAICGKEQERLPG